LQTEEHFCSRYESRGFRVKLHDPASVPVISDYGFVVAAGNEFVVPVMPAVIDADPNIFSVNPQGG
jgi:amiloride-sensitive sodium channel